MTVQAFTPDSQQRFFAGAWAAMATGDTGAPQAIEPSALVTVVTQAGTFGSGQVTWEASFDGGTTWVPCIDIKGTLINQSQVAATGLGTGYPMVRPNCNGTGASGIICRILAVRAG